MTGPAAPAAPHTTPLTGHDPRTAGPYRLLGRLGAGGQGVVYLGQDDRGHRVAVKTISADLEHDPRAKARFAKEIAAAQRVAPFCTAQVLHADLDADTPYVVSEFIEGHTLFRQVRDHGPLPANALYRLAVGTATALAAIHQAEVVHCDFKPDNVILGIDGPRVIDFGIARAYGSDTMSSGVMGTVPYMAPERFRNTDVGPPCDIFAWAATIAFASTGRAPFGNDAMAAVMQRVLHEEPDLTGLTGPLRDLAADCLAKDHRQRPTAQQLLLRLLAHTGTATAATMPIATALRAGSDAATSVLPAPAATDAVPGDTRPAPTPPRPGHTTWTHRLRRQLTDPWGGATALFLGFLGTATGYLAAENTRTAALIGAATSTVVYTTRAALATALDRGDTP